MNYKTYLDNMRPLYKEYTGFKYEPYELGEIDTYNLIEYFGIEVESVSEFYSKEFNATWDEGVF